MTDIDRCLETAVNVENAPRHILKGGLGGDEQMLAMLELNRLHLLTRVASDERGLSLKSVRRILCQES